MNESEIRKVSDIVDKKRVNRALDEIEILKQISDFDKRGNNHYGELREVARVPMSVFVMLPKSIQENNDLYNEWLKKHKEFWIVDKL